MYIRYVLKALIISSFLSLALAGSTNLVAQSVDNTSPVEVSVELKLYPNPTVDYVNIEVLALKEGGYYEFRNIIGKQLLTGQLDNGVTTLNIEEYNKGIYLVSIFDAAGNRLVTKKVLKE